MSPEPTSAFVCPLCKGPLDSSALRHACSACRREFPVVCGIPDFRIEPDPYIALEADRRKGAALQRAGERLSFAELVSHYYAITPEDPLDLGARWTARALAEVPIAKALLNDAGLLSGPADGTLLDLGCSTGGLLIAASGSYRTLVGVDIAFRWLVVGQRRLDEARVPARLVCANAEHLPFPDRTFRAVTCVDVLEHVSDPRGMFEEAHRVSAPGAAILCTANNRYAPLPEPNIHLWGVGLLPRRWQAKYVAARLPSLHRYRIRLRGPLEVERLVQDGGYYGARAEPGLLVAPHWTGGPVQRAIGIYNAVRRVPVIRQLLKWVGPRLQITVLRRAEEAPASARASRGPSPSAIAPADK
jgi:SAM-dependent methyltransferase